MTSDKESHNCSCGPQRRVAVVATPFLRALMLPTHRPPPAIEHLTKLNKFIYHPLSKLSLRWVVIACVFLVSMYFALPVVGHILWRPLELSNYPQAPFPPHSRPGPPHSRPGRPFTWPAPPANQEQSKWDPKKREVQETFQRAWTGYRTIAFPNDELTSLSGGKSNRLSVSSPSAY